MTVTAEEAKQQLNLVGGDDEDEVQLYVDAANEWVATKVTDTDTAAVRLATLFLIDHLWEIQRQHRREAQRGPGSSPLTGGGDDLVDLDGRGHAVPNRVKELLQPYLTSTSATYSFPDASTWPDPVEWL